VYLREHGGKSLHPGTWENALDWATKPLHATSSLIDPDTYRAFDYLVDETLYDASAPAIPEATWRTLIERLNPDDVVEVAWQASHAGYVQYTEPAFHRALDSGHYHAAAGLAECLDQAGQHSRAAELLELTISRAEGKDEVPGQDVLDMRHSLAWMIGAQVSGHGDPQRALDIIRRIVRDGETLLGRTHPRLLSAKLTLARQLGASGNQEEALAIASDVAALALEHNGPNDELTLGARFEAAVWTRHVHGDAAGVEVFGGLLEHAHSVDTVSWPFLIDTAWNLGGALLGSGDAAAAVSVLEQAAAESELAYGRKHARALPVRLSHASAIAAAGDLNKAVELTRELVKDSTDTFGEADLTTLQMKAHFADWTGQAGDRATAIELFESILADGVRVFVDDHWLVVSVRAELTKLCGIATDRDEG
jgi:tetratricopeptide (TPR) repeat protein